MKTQNKNLNFNKSTMVELNKKEQEGIRGGSGDFNSPVFTATVPVLAFYIK